MSLSEKFLASFNEVHDDEFNKKIEVEQQRAASLHTGMSKLKRERANAGSDEIKRDRLTAEIEAYEEKIAKVDAKIAQLRKQRKEHRDSVDESTMKSSSGKTFEIPKGKWKHLRVSAEWEKNNDNDAKGKIGDFRKNGVYLEWTSDDGKSSLNCDVKDISASDSSIHMKARTGMEYWFQRA